MMNWRKEVALLLFGALVLLGLLPSARADEWNKKTVLTLNQPVEVPGTVLQPGTYVFKLMDSPADRHIVQIYNQGETHLYATILAIPDYRLKPADKTVMGFEERPSSSPEALKAWFHPGDQYGQEFVYPKSPGPRDRQGDKAECAHHARADVLSERSQRAGDGEGSGE